MKRISLFLSMRQIKGLKALSSTEGLSVAELIRRAIDSFLSISASQNRQANLPDTSMARNMD